MFLTSPSCIVCMGCGRIEMAVVVDRSGEVWTHEFEIAREALNLFELLLFEEKLSIAFNFSFEFLLVAVLFVLGVARVLIGVMGFSLWLHEVN